MTIVILANTAIMTLDHYPEPAVLSNLLDTLNEAFSWIFTAEMIIKLIGLGFKEYGRDRFNLFDAFIVIISIVENVMFYLIGSKVASGITVLRSIRLLRIFKLARNWTSFRILLQKIIETLPNIFTFGFLLIIFLIVFIILGM
jgi:hypothetical protein